MSDKSLPKPVLPRDPLPDDGDKKGDKPQMPPSARVQSPLTQKKNPVFSANPAKPQVTPPSVKPSGATPPPSMKPPTMKPPAGMPKPPIFSGKPTDQPPVTGSKLPVTGSKPAAATPNTSSATKSPTQPPQTKKKPSFANVKNSPFKYLPFIIGGLVLVGIIWFVISKFTGSKSQPIAPSAVSDVEQVRKTVPAEKPALIYWGLWEPDGAVRDVLDDFEEEHVGLKVNYVKQSHKDYRERLQTAIASKNGPDVFRFHASWTPMLTEELSPMPQSVMTATEYQSIFYPSASKMLNINGQIVGIPLMYDGLGLYYNKEMLIAANSEPPSTWAEVKILANKLTVKEGGSLKRGGMAIGNSSNVEHFADILGLLMLQNGADPADPSSKESQDALSFYTNFVKEDGVWDDKLPSSTVAFARGDAAMMMAPSWRAHEVKAMNPDLDFGIVPVPRLGEERLSWASFWAEGVSTGSKNQDDSWALLKFLSSSEVQKKLYSDQSQVRTFGEIYSRVDLANELAGDELVSPFLEDAPTAIGWHMSSYTHDNGINDLLIKYYEDAITAVLSGEAVDKALETVTQGTNQTLRQYGLK
ncbi:MAG: extracellular solute-binding protein [Candidatus Pacebacteria bacterium]|nr:extracellular solute-binding protein [Candidatus Paceibacterota bacterium]